MLSGNLKISWFQCGFRRIDLFATNILRNLIAYYFGGRVNGFLVM